MNNIAEILKVGSKYSFVRYKGCNHASIIDTNKLIRKAKREEKELTKNKKVDVVINYYDIDIYQL